MFHIFTCTHTHYIYIYIFIYLFIYIYMWMYVFKKSTEYHVYTSICMSTARSNCMKSRYEVILLDFIVQEFYT